MNIELDSFIYQNRNKDPNPICLGNQRVIYPFTSLLQFTSQLRRCKEVRLNVEIREFCPHHLLEYHFKILIII